MQMEFKSERQYGSQREATSSVAQKLRPTAETVCKWSPRRHLDCIFRYG
jgi:hypothetical protein